MKREGGAAAACGGREVAVTGGGGARRAGGASLPHGALEPRGTGVAVTGMERRTGGGSRSLGRLGIK